MQNANTCSTVPGTSKGSGGGKGICIMSPLVQNTNPAAQSLSSYIYDSYLYDACLLLFPLDPSELLSKCPTSMCNLEKQYGGVGKNSTGRKKN
jgi:hypothetical protein